MCVAWCWPTAYHSAFITVLVFLYNFPNFQFTIARFTDADKQFQLPLFPRLCRCCLFSCRIFPLPQIFFGCPYFCCPISRCPFFLLPNFLLPFSDAVFTVAVFSTNSSLKSVCCDISIFSAVMRRSPADHLPLFNLVRNSIVHSSSSVIKDPKYGNVSTCSSCSFWIWYDIS